MIRDTCHPLFYKTSNTLIQKFAFTNLLTETLYIFQDDLVSRENTSLKNNLLKVKELLN